MGEVKSQCHMCCNFMVDLYVTFRVRVMILNVIFILHYYLVSGGLSHTDDVFLVYIKIFLLISPSPTNVSITSLYLHSDG